MELAGEDGSLLELNEGQPLVLGRVAGLTYHDGSVSRHQVVAELLRPGSRKGKEAVGQALGLKLLLQVVGRNPICVVSRGTEGKGKPQVKFLGNGQKEWLSAGDKFSLSIKRPFFYELRFEGRSSPDCQEVSLDSKVNNIIKKNGNSASMTEEEGIAEAVARRQRRMLEREEAGGKDSSRGQHHDSIASARNLGETQRVPHQEQRVARIKEEMEEARGKVGEVQRVPHHEKVVARIKEEGHTENGGSRRAEKVDQNAQKLKEVTDSRTINLGNVSIGAQQDPPGLLASKRGISSVTPKVTRPKVASTKRAPSRKKQEDSDEDSDDSMGSLDDFINDDSEDEEYVQDDDGDDDDDDEEDEEEDELDSVVKRKRRAKAPGQSRRPDCKYGINCYRKNPDHLAQFNHPNHPSA